MIFAIIGLTGSGKTSFIKALTRTSSGGDGAASSLASGTRSVLPCEVDHNDGRRFVFLDTPGFNNICLTDAEILTHIAGCLETNYPSGTELGVVYLHRITDNRIKISPLEYINMLRNRCNSVTVRQICVVTTMWDDVDDKAEAEMREHVLKEEFQKKNVRALFERFEDSRSPSSAWNVANKFVEDRAHLEDRVRHFSSRADKASYIRFRKLLSERKEVVRQLVVQASAEGNMTRIHELQAEHETLDAQLQVAFEEMQRRKISLTRRALEWLKRRIARDT